MLRGSLMILLVPLLLIGACTKEEPKVKDPVEAEEPLPDGAELEDVSLGERDDVPEADVDEASREEIFPSEEEDVPAAAPQSEGASKAVQNAQPVQPDAAVTTASAVYYVKSAVVLVREQPNDASKTLRTLNRGDRVTVTAIQADWANLQGGGFANTRDLSKAVVGSSRKDNSWKSKK